MGRSLAYALRVARVKAWAAVAVHGLALGVAVATSGCAGNSVSGSPSEPPPTFAQLKLEIVAGYGPAPCSNGNDSYQVARSSSHISWAICDYGANPPVSLSNERTISSAELASVTSALAQIAPSAAKNCGADAAALLLDVTTLDGAVDLYANDFYSDCPGDTLAGRTFATGLEGLASVLTQIAKR